MRSFGKLILVLTVSAVLAAPALAQRPRGGRGGFGGGGSQTMLLGQKSVQEELKMSEEQVKKLQEFSAKQRESFRGLRDLSQEERTKKFEEIRKEAEKLVADTLSAEQVKRLKQISLQRQGSRALDNAEVAQALNLSQEQKDKIKTIRDESQKAMRDLFQPGGNREEAQKKFTELRDSTREKINGVLSSDQQAKLKELQGEPFKGEIRFGGPGGRGGQRRPGGNRPANNP